MHDCHIFTALCLAGAASAQGGITTQWTALTPIVAQWVNAPANAPNPIVSHPAGPLPNAPLEVEVFVGTGGSNSASFSVTPLPPLPGVVGRTALRADAYVPYYEQTRTSADLLLRIAGPTAGVGSLELQIVSLGDFPDPNALRVDVGNDGTFELRSNPTAGSITALERHAWFAWDFANGPLEVRVVHDVYSRPAPQFYELVTAFRPWVAGVDTIGDDCGSEAPEPGSTGYTTCYHLAALPPFRPEDALTLRASGIGYYGAFLLSDRPDTVTFQLGGSPSPACDLLDDVVFTCLGGISGARTTAWVPLATEWIAPLPVLPPGLDIHVQHASLVLPYLGLTNRVHIRT
ncbi:MAG: hypothetical protein KDE27_09855 [Planctomycetes bacterium]|nr:hypothetical protein [Planctomycetota bacterium]